ncbi:MAG: hypothetical protein K6E29_01280 [Cyanobacteria bacterium RUI128]|nr:hypothetical protein [Cyanobacteria bacterium RUI128]
MERNGAEALAEQNKAFVRPPNQVDPERTDFASTKEMFGYAKERIIPKLEKEEPFEYTVVANIKDNKVLAEYTGEANSCSLANIDSLPLDEENVVLIHGHPDSFPISRADVRTLLKHKINQVIAIDKDGKFSMVARRRDVPVASLKSEEYQVFSSEIDANSDTCYDMPTNKLLKHMTHYTLGHYSDRLGIRYITNYPYLKEGFK